MKVSPKRIESILGIQLPRRMPVLVTGPPGTGKTEILSTAALKYTDELLFRYPSYEEPTDLKGFPWVYQTKDGDKVKAEFIPYGDTEAILKSDRKIVCFLDDFGQGSPTVQACYMQLLLARKAGVHPVGDGVSFVAASNRRQDQAAVSGVLLPIRSRFLGGIYELMADAAQWAGWAIRHGLPATLVAFVRWKPDMLIDDNPGREIEGYRCPRTIAECGRVQVELARQGLSDKELFEAMLGGIAGEVFATEYVGFCEISKKMLDPRECIKNPATAPIPELYKPDSPPMFFAMGTSFARLATSKNFGAIIEYVQRWPSEYTIMAIEGCIEARPELINTRAYVDFEVRTKGYRQI